MSGILTQVKQYPGYDGYKQYYETMRNFFGPQDGRKVIADMMIRCVRKGENIAMGIAVAKEDMDTAVKQKKDRQKKDKQKKSEQKKDKQKQGGQEQAERSSASGRKRGIWIAGSAAAVVLVLSAVFLLYENSLVYRECYAEAGVEVTAADFVKNPDKPAYFAEGSDAVDVSVPGEYHVKIQTGYFSHGSTLYITDTIAPEGEGVKVNLEMGQECAAEEFVTAVTDATKVTASYAKEPDFELPGRQEVEILLTDLGGNTATVAAELFISQVVTELTVEAGSRPPALSDFVIEGEDAAFLTRVDRFDYTVPADHKVKLRVDGNDYEAVLHIADTVAPVLNVHDVRSFTTLDRTADDFVESVRDVTKVKTAFVTDPDVTAAGEQEVEICATDAGGNQTVKTAKLILEEDKEAPVIIGVTDLNVIVGSTVSYKKNVTVTDNCQEGLSLTVDNSAVNLNVEGTYPIVYVAKDGSGNETTAAASVTVRPRVYDENEVNSIADGVLARIITPDMDPGQKLEAIYGYVQSHVGYISHSEKGNWVRAAYEGLVDGRGDCYVYASTAKVLLTRAGIANMDIAKIPSKTSHYWNLVNVGNGWYHFDTTPRRPDHPHICMWTEEQLMAYSTSHGNSHNYDHSQYPEVN